MIYGLCGKPGGGKSYEAVAYHVIPALKAGRKVITNLPLNIEALSAVFGADVVSELVEIRTFAKGISTAKFKGAAQSGALGKPFSTIECYEDDWRDDNNKGALFIIDECHLVLGRGRTPVEISEWYSMHRHHGFDLLLITQNYRKVDNDICDMIELVYYVSKNTMLGSNKSYTKKVKDGLRGDVVNTEQRKYEKKFFKFYQSHTESNKAVTEANASDVKSIWSHWTVKGSAILFIAFFFMLYKAISQSTKEKEIPVAVVERPVAMVTKKPTLAELQANAKTLKSGIVDKSKSAVVENVNEVKSIVKNQQTHPFYKLGFHIQGRYTVGDINGFVFTASQNGQHVFDMTLKDFYMAGYDVVVLGDCSIELSYKDTYHDFITCDSPRVGLTVAQAKSVN